MRLHEKHRGHEKMHTEMILILFATLVISQVALVKWREIYPSSYHVSYEKGAFNNYVDKKEWVGGLKFGILVHI